MDLHNTKRQTPSQEPNQTELLNNEPLTNRTANEPNHKSSQSNSSQVSSSQIKSSQVKSSQVKSWTQPVVVFNDSCLQKIHFASSMECLIERRHGQKRHPTCRQKKFHWTSAIMHLSCIVWLPLLLPSRHGLAIFLRSSKRVRHLGHLHFHLPVHSMLSTTRSTSWAVLRNSQQNNTRF